MPLSTSVVSFRNSLCLISALTALALTGCGIGAPDTTHSLIVAPAMSGFAFGGSTPIVGATVKAYATGTTPGDGTSTNTGYGVATLLQEANTAAGMSAGQDTTSTGGFQFAGGYNCPAGQFVYVTVTGGNPGSASANTDIVLVAALGRCEDLYTLSSGTYSGYSGSKFNVNEATTIAAAYALGRFSSVSGSGAGTVVSIGAPATNNAAKVSGVSTGCVAGVGPCATTAAAGLAHAFLNASNLVNVFATGGAGARSTLPGDASAIAPQQLVNTIANILVSCVNSTGGIAGDGSACGTIFTDTTIGTSVPANTFSAMVNLAANPTLGGNSANVTNFFNLASAQNNVYQPYVAASTGLNDYSLAISYPSALGIKYAQSGALDINDVYYVGNVTVSGTGPVDVLAFSSNGTLLGTSGSNTTLKNAFNLSIDQKGFGYFGNGGGSSSSIGGSFATGSGTIAGNAVNTLTAAGTGASIKIYALAVDKANNLWAAGTGSGSTLYKATGGTATPSFTAQASPTFAVPSSNYASVAIDPQQNVWVGASGVLAILPNSGTSAASPAYASANLLSYSPAGNPVSGFAFPGTSATSYSAIATSYGQTVGTEGVNPYTPLYSAGQPTITSATTTGVSDPNSGANPAIIGSSMGQADGTGLVWLSDTNSKSIVIYASGTTPTASRVIPCLFNSTTGQCATAFGGNKPNSLSIDSTGSIWVSVPLNAGGSVLQIIGSAAPTWPLLSLGLPAMP